jgi:hypothetical protein
MHALTTIRIAPSLFLDFVRHLMPCSRCSTDGRTRWPTSRSPPNTPRLPRGPRPLSLPPTRSLSHFIVELDRNRRVDDTHRSPTPLLQTPSWEHSADRSCRFCWSWSTSSSNRTRRSCSSSSIHSFTRRVPASLHQGDVRHFVPSRLIAVGPPDVDAVGVERRRLLGKPSLSLWCTTTA